MPRSITIITDCHDENAKGRQIARYASLFPGVNIHLMGTNHDIQAGGFLMDTLDSLLTEDNIIIVNIAPRNGKAKKWKNGTPFGYCIIDGNYIFSSVDGYALSFLKKLSLIKEFHIFDIPTVVKEARETGNISEYDEYYISHTQFRSLEFLPRVAHWIYNKTFSVPVCEFTLGDIANLPHQVWNIDNFGNCKTTLFANELDEKTWKEQKIENLCHKKFLHDLESEEIALVEGSSGYRQTRCIEIIKNGGNIAQEFGYRIGQEI